VLISIAVASPLVQHPGRAQLNQDGSWTVDWQTMKELAARPVYLKPSGPQFDVMIARALLAEKATGMIMENAHPNNDCPAEGSK